MRPFHWLDTKIQAGFDAGVHWFMLTFGVSKGFVRYAFWTAQICRLLGEGWLEIVLGKSGWKAAVSVGLALLFFGNQQLDKHHDAEAESNGFKSRADFSPWNMKIVWWGFLIIGLALSPLEDSVGRERLYVGLQHFGGVLWVALEYLRHTNPRPPERRQRVLAPQHQTV